jgi:hypothetical protein
MKHIQNNGEIEPFFIAEFYEDLGTKWDLRLPNGALHTIEFNKSIVQPLITNGWTDLRQLLQLVGNTSITFKYFGNNFFNVSILASDISPSTFPPFHSLSTAPTFTRQIKVILGRQATTSPLVRHLSLSICILVFLEFLFNHPKIYCAVYLTSFNTGFTKSLRKCSPTYRPAIYFTMWTFKY